MINTIFKIIDTNLQLLKTDPDRHLERIDLDRFYPNFLNGTLMLPKIKLYDGPLPNNLITFNEARARFNKGHSIHGCVCHYIDDRRFQCTYRDPVKYIPFYKSCGTVIGPDFSLYINASEEHKRLNVFRNHLLSLIWQHCGIALIPNVSWAEPFSFDYCFQPFPQNSVVAINSTGCRGNILSPYYWNKGYEQVLLRLCPSTVLRYGPKMENEDVERSQFYANPHLTHMRKIS